MKFDRWSAVAIGALVLLSSPLAMATPTSVNVLDCYTTPSDDDVAINNAVKVASGLMLGFGSCGVSGSSLRIGSVQIPATKNYVINQTILVSKGLTITGVRGSHLAGGMGLIQAAAGASPNPMIAIRTDDPVFLADLTLDAANQTPGQDAILVEGTMPGSQGTENHLSVLERVSVLNGRTGIHLKATSKPTIRGAYVRGFREHGILVENVPFPDHGDGVIEGSWIATTSYTAGTAGIRQYSSGGLKIQNNKIVGPMDHGILFEPTQLTGILLINSNSIEAQNPGSSITLRRMVSNPNPGTPASGDQFTQVVIANNHLGFSYTGVSIYDNVPPNPPSPWLSSVVLEGNTLLSTNFGFVLYEVDGVFISGNIFDNTGLTAVGTQQVGIYIDAVKSPTNVKIAGNAYLSVTYHLAGNPALATQCPPNTCN